MTIFNERTNTLLYKNITSHTLFTRGEWRQGRANFLTQVLLAIAAILSHLGWVAQPWVTEGRKPTVCKLILKLAPCLQLTRTAPGT